MWSYTLPVASAQHRAALDPSFGGGSVVTDISGRVDVAQAAGVEPGGRLVVATTVSDSTSDRYRTVALRYLPSLCRTAHQRLFRASAA